MADLVPQNGGLPTKIDKSVKDLKDKGLATAQSIDSSQYPKLGITPGVPLANKSWLAVTGPYPTAAAAQADCATARSVTGTCFVVQPEPT